MRLKNVLARVFACCMHKLAKPSPIIIFSLLWLFFLCSSAKKILSSWQLVGILLLYTVLLTSVTKSTFFTHWPWSNSHVQDLIFFCLHKNSFKEKAAVFLPLYSPAATVSSYCYSCLLFLYAVEIFWETFGLVTMPFQSLSIGSLLERYVWYIKRTLEPLHLAC